MSVDKVNILNMVKNIAEPDRSRIQHVFNRWKSGIWLPNLKDKIYVVRISETNVTDYNIMKNTFLLLLTIVCLSCNSSKTITEKKIVIENKTVIENKIKEIAKEKAKPVNAQKNDRGYLIGVANKSSFTDTSFKPWFDSRYNEYKTDQEVIEKLKKEIN